MTFHAGRRSFSVTMPTRTLERFSRAVTGRLTTLLNATLIAA